MHRPAPSPRPGCEQRRLSARGPGAPNYFAGLVPFAASVRRSAASRHASRCAIRLRSLSNSAFFRALVPTSSSSSLLVPPFVCGTRRRWRALLGAMPPVTPREASEDVSPLCADEIAAVGRDDSSSLLDILPFGRASAPAIAASFGRERGSSLLELVWLVWWPALATAASFGRVRCSSLLGLS